MKRALLAAVLLAGCAKSGALPDYGALPGFRLTDEEGKSYGSADLAGSVWLADFIYTSCPGPCPALSTEMARLQKELPPAVKLVSFTVDPEKDTPAELREYAGFFGADPARWRFLTGARADVYALAEKGFKLAVSPAPKGLVTHSTKIALVDRAGRLRGYYDGENRAALKRLADDARRLAKAS